jgi:glycosyltransferase involved in cell wall biosynthesis
MAIVIFGDNFSFPEGNAGTNRIYTYAKGFIENNVITYVICFKNDYLVNGNGIIDGIQYFNPLNQSKKNNSFWVRNWFKVVKFFNTVRLVKGINKQDKISAIIVDTQVILTYLFSYYLAKKINTKFIYENSEHPLRYYRKGLGNKIIGNLKLKLQLNTFDGILLITQNLIDFYKSKIQNDKKILLVPSTVDPSRFAVRKSELKPYEYIGYFGSMKFGRDNIDLLIKAYSMIYDKHDDIHLVLGGMASEKESGMLSDLIKSLKIESKVHTLGYLSREEIVQYIINAHILVLVRSNDSDTNASFPCKLTEYLTTGNPVISVKVGEIAKYLIDSQDAFLVEPGDVNGLSEKLDFVLNNYQFAKEIAKRGKDLTESVFNYSFQTKRIIEFIKSL